MPLSFLYLTYCYCSVLKDTLLFHSSTYPPYIYFISNCFTGTTLKLNHSLPSFCQFHEFALFLLPYQPLPDEQFPVACHLTSLNSFHLSYPILKPSAYLPLSSSPVLPETETIFLSASILLSSPPRD